MITLFRSAATGTKTLPPLKQQFSEIFREHYSSKNRAHLSQGIENGMRVLNATRN